MKIYVGDKVRSHDFPRDRGLDRPPCFVEGTVVGFEKIEGCERYKIQVERKVCKRRIWSIYQSNFQKAFLSAT